MVNYKLCIENKTKFTRSSRAEMVTMKFLIVT